MKKIIIISIFTTFLANAQFVYKPITNFINSNSQKGTISILPRVGLDTFEGQLSYNITDQYNIFAMYKNSDGDYTSSDFLWGNSYTTYYKNKGFAVGIGKSINKINKQLSFYVGYENQENEDYQVSTSITQYNQFNYYTIFGMFNYVHFNRKSEVGFASKLSYFKIINHLATGISFKDKSTFTITPTFIFNYNLTKDKKLKLCTQSGFSTFIKSIEVTETYSNETFVSFSSESIFSFNFIINVGLKYDFSILKNPKL